MYTNRNAKLAGLLALAGIMAGVFSVAPSIDTSGYLTEAAKAPGSVTLSAVCQFVMSLTYMGFAVLLYPQVKVFGSTLSIGFLSFRLVAVTLSILATALLLPLLALSKAYLQEPVPALVITGNMLKVLRDQVNHVFMVLALCSGNLMLYTLLLRSGSVPRLLPVCGMIAALLSITASFLLLWERTTIDTPLYLGLNVPSALLELVLGLWLVSGNGMKRV